MTGSEGRKDRGTEQESFTTRPRQRWSGQVKAKDRRNPKRACMLAREAGIRGILKGQAIGGMKEGDRQDVQA